MKYSELIEAVQAVADQHPQNNTITANQPTALTNQIDLDAPETSAELALLYIKNAIEKLAPYLSKAEKRKYESIASRYNDPNSLIIQID